MKINELIKNVQTYFEVSADLQFVDALSACKNKTKDWIKFDDAMSNAFAIVSKLTNECLLEYNKKTTLNGQDDSIALKLLETGFEIDEVRGLIHDLIIAAADTTSYTTLWFFHLLACNSNAQEKARTEVLALADNKRFRTVNLPFLGYCNDESMRMYPVAPFLTRILDEPIKLSEEWDETILKKHTLVLMSIYTMSRNGAYFENPNTFWPERWERDKNKKRKGVRPFASLPFGHGARKCIGKKIAEHQMIYFLARLLEKFRFQSENKSSEVRYKMKLIGMPDRPIRISLSNKL